MRNLELAAIISSLIIIAGCASSGPEPIPDLVYREIPEGYLQECELPSLPAANADMSDAFAQAYQCGEQGNTDKRRIRSLLDGE